MAFDKVIDSAQLDGALEATANKIREKSGETGSIPWDANTGFASAIGSLEVGGGVDTSTATATAGDIVVGKTAFLAGGETTGTMARATSITVTDNTPTIENGKLILNAVYKSPNSKNTYISPTQNTTVKITTDTSYIGDATAADVASGKTFTSSAGVKVTGTATIGGGGGDGVKYLNVNGTEIISCNTFVAVEIEGAYARGQSFPDTGFGFVMFVDISGKKIFFKDTPPYNTSGAVDFSSGTYTFNDQAGGYLQMTYSGSNLAFTITDASKCELDYIRGMYA